MKKRITTYITVIVTIPLIIFISIFSSIISAIVLNQEVANLELTTDNLVEYISSTYENQIRGSENFLESPEILAFLENPTDQERFRAAETSLLKVFSVSESNSSLTIISEDGRILLTSEEDLYNDGDLLTGNRFPLFKLTVDSKELNSRIYFEDAIPMLDMAFPIIINGQIYGVLNRETPLTYISNYAKNINLNNEVVYFLTNHGRGIRYAPGQGNFIRTITLFEGTYANSPAVNDLVNELFSNPSQAGNISYSINNSNSIGSFEKIPELDLVCMTSQPRSLIYYHVNIFLFIVLAASLVLISLISSFIARYFTKLASPIADYNDIIEKFMEGEDKERAPTTGFNFIGSLGEKINSLFDEIIKTRDYSEEVEEELTSLLTTDQVTNLNNNRALYNVIDEFFGKDPNQAIIMLNTGTYNDLSQVFGNSVTNRMLEVTAKYINDIKDEYTFPARLGKDNFCIFISHFNNQEDLEEKSRQLLNRLSKISHIDDLQVDYNPHMVIVYNDESFLGRSDWLRMGLENLRESIENNISFKTVDLSPKNTSDELVENIIYQGYEAKIGFSKSNRRKNNEKE